MYPKIAMPVDYCGVDVSCCEIQMWCWRLNPGLWEYCTSTLPMSCISSTADFILQFYHSKQTNKPKTNNVKRTTIKDGGFLANS